MAKSLKDMTKDELIDNLNKVSDENTKKDQLIKKMQDDKKQAESISLAQKIAKANKEIGTIDKDGSNDKQHYTYQSMEAIRAAVRRVLYENGLAVFPSFDKPEYVERRTSKGHIFTFARVMGHFEVTDGKESKVCDFPGEGSDVGDKSVQKACTSAQKYFYKEIFNVSDRDEQDPDSTDSAPEGGYVADNYQPQSRRQSNYSRGNYYRRSSKPSPAAQQAANKIAKQAEIKKVLTAKVKAKKIPFGGGTVLLTDVLGLIQDKDRDAPGVLQAWLGTDDEKNSRHKMVAFIRNNDLITHNEKAVPEK